MSWTKEQQKVIDLRKRNLLVSAAAGSGKTAVLIERILGLITDPEKPLDIDRLLVVTFTRAAAGEMRERLNSAIEKKLSDGEENEHLVRQMTLIQNAQITTIDSFCSYVLKNYFHVIGLDPNYRVMDEGEGKLLKSQVLQELLEERYEEETGKFRYFVECFATGKDDQALEDSVLRLYEFAMSYPYPEKWLEKCIRAYQIESMEKLLETDWMKELTASIQALIRDLKDLTERALTVTREVDGPYIYEAALQSDLEFLESLLAARNYEEIYALLDGAKPWARLSAKKDENIREEKKDLVKAIREEVKEAVKDLKEQYFFESPQAEFEDMKAAGEPMSVLVELTLDFMEWFAREKREKNLCDFHDMEHLALKILVGEDGEPTDTARELSGQFEEIMIDEYQDSNLVQEAILTAVSREKEGVHNLFMVGDVKQSIYRFRLARPELFLSKYQTYTREESENQRIDLSKNFRSRREILAFTNQIFLEVMREKPGAVVYDAAAALYPGAEYPEGNEEKLKPEILLFDLDESKELTEKTHATPSELEAWMTGKKILSMVGKEEVFDKELGAMRKMEFRDIVILFRSPMVFAESYGKVLGDLGIPVFVGSRSGYFSAREVQVVLALLGIIDNSDQDIPLATVLLSPIGGFSEKDLANIKGEAGEEKSFYESCLWYAGNGAKDSIRENLKKFYGMVEEFRQRAPYTPIHELLWYIFDYTGYEDYASAMPAGEQRSLNLKMLVQKAWDYEKTSYRGLFNFIRYIENLQKYDVDYGEAGLMGEERNVVRIMSIHKSKGLEFPVVILGGLEKQFNQQDTRSRLVLDVDLGAGFDMVDPILRVRRPTLFKRCVQKKVKDDNIGEEIRVLYVALTRAKEKLILTGVLSGLEKKVREWYQNINPGFLGLSYRELSGAGGYLDFLMPVLLKYESAKDFLSKLGISQNGCLLSGNPVWSTDFVICRVDIQEILADELGRQVKDVFDMQSLKSLNPDTVYDGEFRKLLKERMEGAYPYGDSSHIPVKLTVSQLKRQSDEEEEAGVRLFEDEKNDILWMHESAQAEYEEMNALETGYEQGHVPETEHGRGNTPERLIPEFMKDSAPMEGSARGTAYHSFLQYLDFGRCGNLAGVKEQLNGLCAAGRLTEGEACAIDCRRILRLCTSDLGRRMARAQRDGRLFREQHFIYGVPASEIYPEISFERTLLIQGVIDAYFEEEGSLILVDYKTDFVKKGEEALLYRKYAPQLAYYEQALTQLTGKPVREKIIYSLFRQKELREN